MKIKPVCRRCKKPFLVGKDGLCQACITPGSRPRKLYCYCGRLAKHVIFVTVLNPEGAPRTLQLALCPNCLALEEEWESEPPFSFENPTTNPVKILVVDKVPPANAPPKGRKVA